MILVPASTVDRHQGAGACQCSGRQRPSDTRDETAATASAIFETFLCTSASWSEWLLAVEQMVVDL